MEHPEITEKEKMAIKKTLSILKKDTFILQELDWLPNCLIEKRLQQEPNLHRYYALKAVYTDILEKMGTKNSYFAKILRGRYWKNLSVIEMTFKLGESESDRIPDSTFYSHQSNAIDIFSNLLWHEEQRCQQTAQEEVSVAAESQEEVSALPETQKKKKILKGFGRYWKKLVSILVPIAFGGVVIAYLFMTGNSQSIEGAVSFAPSSPAPNAPQTFSTTATIVPMPMRTTTPILLIKHTSTATTPLISRYQILSLREVKRREGSLGLKEGINEFPNLPNVPFETGWTMTTECSDRSTDPTRIQIELNPSIRQPVKVHFLLQAGWATQNFAHQTFGTITLGFIDGETELEELVVGKNMRDWKQYNPEAVTTSSSPTLREVHAGNAPNGTPGHIDALTINISAKHQNSALTTIQIDDFSELTTKSDNPCIYLLAVTVEYIGYESESFNEIIDERPSQMPTIIPKHVVEVPYPLVEVDIQERFLEIWEFLDGIGGPLGNPKEIVIESNYAYQRFDNGYMFWWENPRGQNYIWVVNSEGQATIGQGWSRHDDTWISGKDPDEPPDCPDIQKPNGPFYGFGKLWCSESSIKQGLGPALEPEFGSVNINEKTTIQLFSHGTMIYVPVSQEIWVLLDNGEWRMFAR